MNGGASTTWGAGGANTSLSSGATGGTYNITNNNNINYNYGSNVTAISSASDGPVPTFHELDKQRKKDAKSGSGVMGGIGSAMSSVG